ncbi:NAD-dependent epimerase [Streptosporangium violaceochromogenes]|nr:NAD-dependent epimerase [Streptosporangium violaceochromogenes]
MVTALEGDESVTSVIGVARRPPVRWEGATEWRAADVTVDDLGEVFEGADAVVHLAWLFQPTRRPSVTWRTNVLGSARVFRAVAEAGVSALVYASSVGAYSPGPKDRAVDEGWPTDGWPGAAYSREKAYVERVLDVFERDHPGIRVVRMRPGFIFKREAATEQRRLFAGPLLPGRLVRPGMIPFVPDIPGLRIQALHSLDAGEAYRLAVTRQVRGAFNLAAEPVLDTAALAGVLGARPVPVPSSLARAVTAAGWHLHLIPAAPGLLDMALRLPVMDITRAHRELGWQPRHTALDAVRELLGGLREGAGADTAPLAPDTDAGGRLREFLTGVGQRP